MGGKIFDRYINVSGGLPRFHSWNGDIDLNGGLNTLEVLRCTAKNGKIERSQAKPEDISKQYIRMILIHPGKFNGWNLKNRNIIWTKPPAFVGSIFILRV